MTKRHYAKIALSESHRNLEVSGLRAKSSRVQETLESCRRACDDDGDGRRGVYIPHPLDLIHFILLAVLLDVKGIGPEARSRQAASDNDGISDRGRERVYVHLLKGFVSGRAQRDEGLGSPAVRQCRVGS